MIVHATVMLRSREDVIVSVTGVGRADVEAIRTRSRLTAAFLAAPGTLLRNTRQDLPKTSQLLCVVTFVYLLVDRRDSGLRRR
jgi:hypothetical protein